MMSCILAQFGVVVVYVDVLVLTRLLVALVVHAAFHRVCQGGWTGVDISNRSVGVGVIGGRRRIDRTVIAIF